VLIQSCLKLFAEAHAMKFFKVLLPLLLSPQISLALMICIPYRDKFTSFHKRVFSQPKIKMSMSEDRASVFIKSPESAIATLAGLGTLETGYLTWLKFSDYQSPLVSSICSGDTCNSVLSSPYSSLPLLNIPLASIAFLFYAGVFLLSIINVLTPTLGDRSIEEQGMNSRLILVISSGMATFSLYLMFLLTFVLRQKCAFCLLSASFTFGMAYFAWNGRLVRNGTTAFVLTSATSLVTALTSALIFYFTSSSIAIGNIGAVSTSEKVSETIQKVSRA